MPVRAPDVIFDSYVETLPELTGKVIAITGCTSGTGYWAAHVAVIKGAAALILLNRASKRATDAEEKLKVLAQEKGVKTEVTTVSCDLMSFAAVRKAAAEVQGIAERFGGLDALVNNAGIMGFPDNRTEDGFDVQMQTNHLSHFLLTKLLLGVLQQAADSRGEARVVQHSSGARDFKIKNKSFLEVEYFQKNEAGSLGGNGASHAFARYHMTKLANSVYSLALHDRLQAKGMTKIKAVTAEPGIATTDLVVNLQQGQDSISCCSVYGCIRLLLPCCGCLLGRISQSAADGACPLMAAAYATNTDSGDFYMPKKGATGLPMKTLSKGEIVKAGKEEFTTHGPSRDLLWNASEEAIGEKFLD